MGTVLICSSQDLPDFGDIGNPGLLVILCDGWVAERAKDNDIACSRRRRYSARKGRYPELRFEAIYIDRGEKVGEWTMELKSRTISSGIRMGDKFVGLGIVNFYKASRRNG